MNYRLTCCVFLTLTLTLAASAQTGKPAAGRGTTTPGPTRSPGPTQPNMNPPDTTMGQRAFITGKVVLDDGTQITESATIQTICRGHKQTVTHTDSRGGFSFELGDRTSAASAGLQWRRRRFHGPCHGPRGTSATGATASCWPNCPASLRSPSILNSRLTTFESADIGRLVLHRMGQVEGLTISATSAMAPKDAQKAYEKGSEKAKPRRNGTKPNRC